jgi:hypothetical protein
LSLEHRKMNLLTKEEKDKLFRQVQEDVTSVVGFDVSLPGLCMLWTLHGLRRLQELDVRVILQAGTAYWPRVPDPANTPEDVQTHFGYEWSPDESISNRAILAGMLPEMHTWLAIPETQEMIDFSTGTWPVACNFTLGPWTGDDPPDYLWATNEQMGEAGYGCKYEPHPAACFFAESKLRDFSLEEVSGGADLFKPRAVPDAG